MSDQLQQWNRNREIHDKATMLARHRSEMRIAVIIGFLLGLFSGLAAPKAFATCTVGSDSVGALAVFSTFVFPSSAGTITVTNDSAGTHTVTIPGIDALVADVEGVDLDGYMTMTPQVVSGPNTGAPFGGSDSSARTLVLTNAGTDVISLSVQGTLDSTAVAGTYQVNAIVDCI